jgi:phosphoribosylanthranilate isomerase
MFVKVCGMRESANIQEVARLKPDLMGFIFYPKSKRYVGEDFAPAIIQGVMPEVQTVGVFVNEEVERVMTLVRKYHLDFVQLHGNESPASCQKIKDKGVKVLKAFGIHENFDWEILGPYIGSCDYFLFDTSTKDYGGSGKKFTWNILDNYKQLYPFVLSGGIAPEDGVAIRKIGHPQLAGIDINSCFEKEPGLKDAGKLEKFMNEVRND